MKKCIIIGLSILSLVSCGKSKKQKEAERNMDMLESLFEQQIQSGQGQRYQNLNEAAVALEQERRMQQEQGQYQRVQCSSCGGRGQYYDYEGTLMTCPTCAGYGYVHKYN